jgi:hypothetical protein
MRKTSGYTRLQLRLRVTLIGLVAFVTLVVAVAMPQWSIGRDFNVGPFKYCVKATG